MKVREAILAEKERTFGAESKEVGGALYDLGDSYWRLGDSAKHRDVLERALPIYKREYGKDSLEMAALLNRDSLGILWSYYYFRGFDTRSAVALFDARDRASLRNKKREKAAPAARGALAT